MTTLPSERLPIDFSVRTHPLYSPMTQAAKLRELMRRPGIIKTVGAHDALSAKLIEEAGFDAIWASGFGISASLKCIPDGSFLTMTEQLEVTKNIVEVFFSSRRRHTRLQGDWSSDVCSSDLRRGPSRSQATRSVLAFFAQDHVSTDMVYANADV